MVRHRALYRNLQPTNPPEYGQFLIPPQSTWPLRRPTRAITSVVITKPDDHRRVRSSLANTLLRSIAWIGRQRQQ